MNHEDYDTNVQTDGEKDECETCNGLGCVREYEEGFINISCPECGGQRFV